MPGLGQISVHLCNGFLPLVWAALAKAAWTSQCSARSLEFGALCQLRAQLALHVAFSAGANSACVSALPHLSHCAMEEKHGQGDAIKYVSNALSMRLGHVACLAHVSLEDVLETKQNV